MKHKENCLNWRYDDLFVEKRRVFDGLDSRENRRAGRMEDLEPMRFSNPFTRDNFDKENERYEELKDKIDQEKLLEDRSNPSEMPTLEDLDQKIASLERQIITVRQKGDDQQLRQLLINQSHVKNYREKLTDLFSDSKSRLEKLAKKTGEQVDLRDANPELYKFLDEQYGTAIENIKFDRLSGIGQISAALSEANISVVNLNQFLRSLFSKSNLGNTGVNRWISAEDVIRALSNQADNPVMAFVQNQYLTNSDFDQTEKNTFIKAVNKIVSAVKNIKPVEAARGRVYPDQRKVVSGSNNPDDQLAQIANYRQDTPEEEQALYAGLPVTLGAGSDAEVVYRTSRDLDHGFSVGNLNPLESQGIDEMSLYEEMKEACLKNGEVDQERVTKLNDFLKSQGEQYHSYLFDLRAGLDQSAANGNLIKQIDETLRWRDSFSKDRQDQYYALLGVLFLGHKSNNKTLNENMAVRTALGDNLPCTPADIAEAARSGDLEGFFERLKSDKADAEKKSIDSLKSAVKDISSKITEELRDNGVYSQDTHSKVLYNVIANGHYERTEYIEDGTNVGHDTEFVFSLGVAGAIDAGNGKMVLWGVGGNTKDQFGITGGLGLSVIDKRTFSLMMSAMAGVSTEGVGGALTAGMNTDIEDLAEQYGIDAETHWLLNNLNLKAHIGLTPNLKWGAAAMLEKNPISQMWEQVEREIQEFGLTDAYFDRQANKINFTIPSVLEIQAIINEDPGLQAAWNQTGFEFNNPNHHYQIINFFRNEIAPRRLIAAMENASPGLVSGIGFGWVAGIPLPAIQFSLKTGVREDFEGYSDQFPQLQEQLLHQVGLAEFLSGFKKDRIVTEAIDTTENYRTYSLGPGDGEIQISAKDVVDNSTLGIPDNLESVFEGFQNAFETQDVRLIRSGNNNYLEIRPGTTLDTGVILADRFKQQGRYANGVLTINLGAGEFHNLNDFNKLPNVYSMTRYGINDSSERYLVVRSRDGNFDPQKDFRARDSVLWLSGNMSVQMENDQSDWQNESVTGQDTTETLETNLKLRKVALECAGEILERAPKEPEIRQMYEEIIAGKSPNIVALSKYIDNLGLIGSNIEQLKEMLYEEIRNRKYELLDLTHEQLKESDRIAKEINSNRNLPAFKAINRIGTKRENANSDLDTARDYILGQAGDLNIPENQQYLFVHAVIEEVHRMLFRDAGDYTKAKAQDKLDSATKDDGPLEQYFKREMGVISNSDSTNESPGFTNYTVKPGDSLWKIAKDQNVDFRKLKEANRRQFANLSLIKPGDTVLIPNSSTEKAVSVVDITERAASSVRVNIKSALDGISQDNLESVSTKYIDAGSRVAMFAADPDQLNQASADGVIREMGGDDVSLLRAMEVIAKKDAPEQLRKDLLTIYEADIKREISQTLNILLGDLSKNYNRTSDSSTINFDQMANNFYNKRLLKNDSSYNNYLTIRNKETDEEFNTEIKFNFQAYTALAMTGNGTDKKSCLNPLVAWDLEPEFRYYSREGFNADGVQTSIRAGGSSKSMNVANVLSSLGWDIDDVEIGG
jgi:LysM repeat protein